MLKGVSDVREPKVEDEKNPGCYVSMTRDYKHPFLEKPRWILECHSKVHLGFINWQETCFL